MEVPAFPFRGPDANFASAKGGADILGPGGSREPYEEQRLAGSSVPPADVLRSSSKTKQNHSRYLERPRFFRPSDLASYLKLPVKVPIGGSFSPSIDFR
jgi:hypothetical protein